MGEQKKQHRWKKGECGNPRGRPKGVHEAAKAALQAIADACTPEAMREMAEALVRQAREGDQKAIEIVLDRLAGKPRQSMDVTGDVSLSVEIITPLSHVTSSN